MDQLASMGPAQTAVALSALGLLLGLLLLQLYSTRRPKGSPPVVQMGIPLLGNPIQFVKGPLDMIKACKKT